MSYQFDASQLRPDNRVKLQGEVTTLRLLARRTARQMRRAQRSF